MSHIKRFNRNYVRTLMSEMGFNLLGHGVHRETYLSPNEKYVLKFPICETGINVNIKEHETWHKFKNSPDHSHGGALYAPCRLINKIVLMMWAVKESYGDSEGDDRARLRGYLKQPASVISPSWIRYFDCYQAGPLANGKVVAYDYGSDVFDTLLY
jgi:hypothetical protein